MNAYQSRFTHSDLPVAPSVAAAQRSDAGSSHDGGGARPDAARPAQVAGPFGKPLRWDDLPSPETRRWVVRRKAEVIAAIRGGLLTSAEACARYRLSPEELELWAESLDRAGVPGLRVTRIQLYRDYPVEAPKARATARAQHSRDLSSEWER